MADGGVMPGEPKVGATPTPVEVMAHDCVGTGVVFCPNPKMPLWSNHPRVFIDVGSTGEGKCPYCGTAYRLAPGEKLHSH